LHRAQGFGFLALSGLSFLVSLLSIATLTISLLDLFEVPQTPHEQQLYVYGSGVVLILSVILGCLSFQFGVRYLRLAAPLRALL
jgi:hypothetical protein